MKCLFKLWLLVVILMTSCSSENGSFTNLYEEDQAKDAPSNPRNPYDFVGENYLRLLQKQPLLSPSGRDDTLKQSGTIQSVLSKQDSTVYSIDALWDLINQSELTLPAKGTLKNYITVLLDSDPSDYNDLYVYIIDYEAQILEDALLTAEDKQVILSFSSIVRFAAFGDGAITTQSEGEDDDEDDEEDWDISVPNIMDWLLTVLDE